MHYRMNNSNDYGHLRVRSNIVRLRGSQILSRVYLVLSATGRITLRAAQGRVGLTGLQWAGTPVRCIGE